MVGGFNISKSTRQKRRSSLINREANLHFKKRFLNNLYCKKDFEETEDYLVFAQGDSRRTNLPAFDMNNDDCGSSP